MKQNMDSLINLYKNNKIISYTQEAEDIILWKLLSHVEKGYYVDIGCYDPESGNVTKIFYDKGWRGINCDALPYIMDKYKSARPDDTNLNMGVSDIEGELDFYTRQGLSTFDPSTVERLGRNNFKIIKIKVKPLNNILQDFDAKEIHFLKIDVEHFEAKVLAGVDLVRYRPWVICVEATLPCTTIPCHQEWESKIINSGYKFYTQGRVNRYYIAQEKYEELDTRFKTNSSLQYILYSDLRNYNKAHAEICKELNQMASGPPVPPQPVVQETTADLSALRAQKIPAHDIDKTRRIWNETLEKREYLKGLASRYDKIVICGVRDYFHTAGFVYKGWKDFLDKLEIPCTWIDNLESSSSFISPRSLVYYHDESYSQQKLKVKFNPEASYIFHRADSLKPDFICQFRHIRLFEYRKVFENNFNKTEKPVKIRNFTFLYPGQKVMLQPWGTHLMPNEFLSPTSNRKTKKCFFIGTIWDQNKAILQIIQKDVETAGYEFVVKSRLSQADEKNITRYSFAALAPGHPGQVEQSYLQCRIFKSISYGRMVFTNVTGFRDILGDSFLPINNFADALNITRVLPESVEREICKQQQQSIYNYSYLDAWINMLEAMEACNP